MLCTVWSICIHAHILHVDICCKASFISCLIKTRDGITYIIIIYIHIHMIPYYNFGIKKKAKYTTQTWSFFTRCIHGKKQPQSRNQFNLLPRAPTLPSITYSGFLKETIHKIVYNWTLRLKHCCTREEQPTMTYTYLPILTTTSSAHVGTIAIYPGWP